MSIASNVLSLSSVRFWMTTLPCKFLDKNPKNVLPAQSTVQLESHGQGQLRMVGDADEARLRALR